MSFTAMGDALIEASIRRDMKATSEAVAALRDRLDAELRLVHSVINGINAKLDNVEERVADLERRMYMSPELMAEIEKGSLE